MTQNMHSYALTSSTDSNFPGDKPNLQALHEYCTVLLIHNLHTYTDVQT